ncbi:hypothetical protein BN946_scf184780.g2 [Trametes cinnabarina]|uniref:Ubinuclein middle domain-containing protein n=1 Tax=Pycnoporus cinnabarinus TaxID=5643 RepID=A0A060SNM3_PYCCI|nr:hypothetical protein BN946_scf184780.g2 [Trametes cinnabarina]
MDIVPSDVQISPNDAQGSREGAQSASASSSASSSSPPPSSPAHPSPAPDDNTQPSTSTALPPRSTPKTAQRPQTRPPPRRRARGPKTIRLDIKLGGPDDYEVNIADLAKATGQRPATPVPEAKRDTSDESEGDDDDHDGESKRAADAAGKPKKRNKVRLVLQANVDPALTLPRQRRHYASEYYDTSDPFIDDSELAQDERTFFAQTKQKGFYVSSGQVALLSKAPQRKPKSKKVNILAPSASVTAALSTATLPLPALSASTSTSYGNVKPKIEGSSEAPIALLSDAEEASGSLKRKMSETQSVASSTGDGNAKKKRKTVEIRPFHPELEQAIDVLKEAIAKEDWSVKGKFPPGIKPILGQVALKAVILGEYDDNFFNLMPKLFPYNKFTMTMKQIIWQLVCLSNECCRIENEKNALEGSNQVVSDQGVRKTLYQKIVAAFPEGWLSSGQISREVSVMKKKYEKESMEID